MLLCDLDLTRSLFLPYCTSFILGRISFLFYYKKNKQKKVRRRRAIFKLWHTFSVSFREKGKKTESFALELL